ncbi:MAG: hypothetical protein A3H97_07360 [Acidobacteria bacterium RIFCSPLOWO2_02_FULL_65_29]|nr:MAG: hypothetical protein A3H97_07360 [Acidobacteria bacterium RIFCSPLOWO2_02_FULL_65_29]
MMKRGILGSVALAVLFLAATPLIAHHALQAEFDTAKRGAFTGVLTKFSMINPHVRWYFDVTGSTGTVSKWEVIGAGPQALRDNGMTRIFKAGETLEVTYAPARDGSNLGRVVTFTFPDGRVVTLYHEDPSNPNDR